MNAMGFRYTQKMVVKTWKDNDPAMLGNSSVPSRKSVRRALKTGVAVFPLTKKIRMTGGSLTQKSSEYMYTWYIFVAIKTILVFVHLLILILGHIIVHRVALS